MKRFLLALVGMLAFPAVGWAASAGDSCDALLTATKYKTGSYKCIYLTPTISSATTTNGPVTAVPFSRVKSMEVSIYSPTATNCTFDSGQVAGHMASTDSATGGHRYVYGVLDDDTPAAAPDNTVGVIVPEGVLIRPYVSVTGLATGGTCTTTNAIDVLGIFQEDLAR